MHTVSPKYTYSTLKIHIQYPKNHIKMSWEQPFHISNSCKDRKHVDFSHAAHVNLRNFYARRAHASCIVQALCMHYRESCISSKQRHREQNEFSGVSATSIVPKRKRLVRGPNVVGTASIGESKHCFFFLKIFSFEIHEVTLPPHTQV